MKKKGLLLINLGTPDHCDTRSVRRYLSEFLSDPRVIDLPSWIRWILVHGIILRVRPRSSAKLYQKIWKKEGSPLLFYSQELQKALSKKMPNDVKIVFGMRYGNPSIETALSELRDCESITVLPLFPQYASASTGSAIEKTLRLLAKQWNIPSLRIIHDFYNDPGFIQAYANIIQQTLSQKKIDKLIFSYHGLPERHLTKSECIAKCDHLNTCPRIDNKNRFCYRAQCFETSRLLAEKMGISQSDYAVVFQSRLGKTPWIKPYTDLFLPELYQQGARTIAIACPSFVADCLETLEEIGVRANEQWKALGGKELLLIPCLNSDSEWINALIELLQH